VKLTWLEQRRGRNLGAVGKLFVTGEAPAQAALCPERLDDFVDEENPVRVIDAFVEQLDLRALGVAAVDPKAKGRPAFHPAVPLKLYIHGYLDRVQSGRRNEMMVEVRQRDD
jgi:transposase